MVQARTKWTDRLAYVLGRKSLYDLHPELANRVPIMRMYSDDATHSTLGTTGAEFYEINVWVQRAVSIVANNIAPLPVRVIAEDGREVPGHPITALLRYVNSGDAPSDLWRGWATEMLLSGECGFEFGMVGRRYAEIWMRSGASFSVRVADRRYREITGYRISDGVGEYEVPPEAFCHFRFYNPAQPLRGLSPISAIRMGILIDEFSRAWARMFFKNAARPDLIITAPEGLTATERREIEDDIAARYSGLEGMHKPLVIEAGVNSIETVSYPPKDTEWLQQREFSRQEIGAIFGVPDEMMGFGRDTYENYGTAKEVLWEITLLPMIRSRDDRLTEFFRGVGQLAPGQEIATDLSEVAVLREDRGPMIAQWQILVDRGVPGNLAAQWLGMGLEYPGGDQGYLPISMVPVGSSPYTEEQPVRALSAVTKAVEAPEFGSPEHTKLWQRKVARVTPFEKRMQQLLKREFQRQQVEVGRALRQQEVLGRGKCVFDAELKQNVRQLFDLQQEAEKFRVRFAPLFVEALRAVGEEELASLGIDIAFDLNRPEVQSIIDYILAQFAEKVNDTTYNDLVDLFSEAELAGESIPDIMERLSSYWEGRKSDASTERIARTTMTSLNSAGDDVAWQQAGDLIDGSIWMTAIDGRERQAHREAHGQYRKLGEMFEVGGEMLTGPGDPNGSPENIINCRCTRKPVLKEL